VPLTRDDPSGRSHDPHPGSLNPSTATGWVYEEKIDGYRMLAYRDGKPVRLVSRTGVDHGKRFPDLVAAVASLPVKTLVLDDEVAVFDQLRSRFDWLRDPDPDAVASPPLFMAFDMLYQDGRDLSARPLRDRRARLEDVIAGSELVFPVRRLEPDGLAAWKQVIERGYEGYVAKDEASAYEGGRTRRWLKVKQKDWTVDEDGWRRRIGVAPSPRRSSANPTPRGRGSSSRRLQPAGLRTGPTC
jgi:bifunctional non-homologous end joining protein LigD